MDLNDKTAIVTGAGRGIGREIALSLSQEGCRVVLVSRTRDELEKVKSEIEQSGGKSLTMAVDISKKHNIDKIIDSTLEEFDTVDILINNAGIQVVSTRLCKLLGKGKIISSQWYRPPV